MAFRLRIAEILKERRLTTGKLSRGADIPLSTARRMAKDPAYQPRLETLAKAARFLGVSIDDLYYYDGTESEKAEKEGPDFE